MDVLLPFLQSTPGKMLRVVMGLTVVAFGTLVIQDTVGFLVAVIGLIPLFAALSGECLIAPSLGTHLRGTRRHIRNTKCSQFPKHAGEAERFSYAWQPSPGSRAGDDRYLGTLVFLRSLSLVRSRFRSKRKQRNGERREALSATGDHRVLWARRAAAGTQSRSLGHRTVTLTRCMLSRYNNN